MAVKKMPFIADITGALAFHYYSDTAGDVLYLDSSSLCTDKRHVQNLSFQCSEAANLQFTLSPTRDAINPNPVVQSGILWDAPIALSAKAITLPGKGFTALKITFTNPGELHIALL